MKNRKINSKQRLLDLLDNFKVSDDLTISELKKEFSEDITTYKKEINKHEKKLLKDFKGSFLKRMSSDGLFDSLDIIHISNIRYESYTENLDRVYHCSGDKISFSSNNLIHCNHNKLDDLLTEKKLRSYEVITQSEYDEYMVEYVNLMTRLKNIVNIDK